VWFRNSGVRSKKYHLEKDIVADELDLVSPYDLLILGLASTLV
jgi:hypothetical protein